MCSLLKSQTVRLLTAALFALVTQPLAALDIQVVALFQEKAMVSIDGKRRLLAVGEISPEGVELISADASEAILEIGGSRGVYGLGTRISANYAPAPEPESVRLRSDRQGVFKTLGTIEGKGVSFLVDTGADQIAMNRSEAERLGLDLSRAPRGFAETASGIAPTFHINLRRVKVGHIELRNVPAVVVDHPTHPREVLLGMSFLSQLDIAHDGDMMRLRKK